MRLNNRSSKQNLDIPNIRLIHNISFRCTENEQTLTPLLLNSFKAFIVLLSSFANREMSDFSLCTLY